MHAPLSTCSGVTPPLYFGPVYGADPISTPAAATYIPMGGTTPNDIGVYSPRLNTTIGRSSPPQTRFGRVSEEQNLSTREPKPALLANGMRTGPRVPLPPTEQKTFQMGSQSGLLDCTLSRSDGNTGLAPPPVDTQHTMDKRNVESTSKKDEKPCNLEIHRDHYTSPKPSTAGSPWVSNAWYVKFRWLCYS